MSDVAALFWGSSASSSYSEITSKRKQLYEKYVSLSNQVVSILSSRPILEFCSSESVRSGKVDGLKLFFRAVKIPSIFEYTFL